MLVGYRLLVAPQLAQSFYRSISGGSEPASPIPFAEALLARPAAPA